MRLVLHIGTPKTGTTALQTALRTGSDRLRRAGVLYPSPPVRRRNHNLLTTALGDNGKIEREFAVFDDGDEQSIRARGATYWEQLGQEVTNASPEVVILSGEYFYGLRQPGVRQLGALLTELTTDIQVVCYVRDPVSYYVAMTAQLVRASHVIPPPNSFRMRARECLSRYLEVFDGRVAVRSSDRAALVDGDIVADFVRWFVPEAADVAGELERTSLNESLSAEAMCVVQLLRRHGWPHEDGSFAPESDRVVEVLKARRELWQQTPAALRLDLAARFHHEHREDLRFLAEHFGVTFRAPDCPVPGTATPRGWMSGDLTDVLDVDSAEVERVTFQLLKELAETSSLRALAIDRIAHKARTLVQAARRTHRPVL